MSIPLLPETAPFSAEQRAWLNGFFAGLLNIEDSKVSLNGAAAQAAAEDETFPWHDPALGLDERLEMAEGKPFPRQLMAAMAQLDCGTCGYLCQTYAEAIASGADKDLSKCSPGGKETRNKLKELMANAPEATGGVATVNVPSSAGLQPVANGTQPAIEPAFDRSNPFPAPVLDVRSLTRPGSLKDVRFISLGLRGSGLNYQAGDALGVYPENCTELVEEILTEMEASGQEPTLSPEGAIVPARIALAKGYVINQVSEELLACLAGLAAREDEAERLRLLAAGEDEDYLEGRDLLDVLHDFPSARPRQSSHVGQIIATLSPLRPRLYSISSSPAAHEGEVHLTVGVVRYGRSGSERMRKGVASTFLSERAVVGQRVGVFVQPSHGFKPPADGEAPMIMVGPGTGIAPFRAFLAERHVRGHRGRNWLFFGDQRRSTDFLYQEELEGHLHSGLLTRLDLAFSRDQQEKVYVQHRMLESGRELWNWLEDGGHFYVCGDASRMAKDVDAALHRIVREHGGRSEDGAKAYVAEMAKNGRYGRDVY